MKATQFLTVEDFAGRLGVPPARVRRWLREGRLPHVRLGRTVKIPMDALERLLETDARSPEAAP
jgi:excisionase family DNA binding protein